MSSRNRHKRPLVHSNTIHLRLSPRLHKAISDAAAARAMTASTWVRQAVITVARLEGILSTPDEPETARIELE